MEAGKGLIKGQEASLDLIDAMVLAGDPSVSDEEVEKLKDLRAQLAVLVPGCSLQIP